MVLILGIIARSFKKTFSYQVESLLAIPSFRRLKRKSDIFVFWGCIFLKNSLVTLLSHLVISKEKQYLGAGK